MALRARFIPRHPEKYVGDVDKIFARSSWEVTVMKKFDSHPDVLRWGSEEISIPYLSPADSRVHMYYPDFFMEYVDKHGVVHKEIVEVKPQHESEAAHAKSDRSKEALIINEAKWKSATLYCEQRGMLFRVITEKSIYHQGAPKAPKVKAPKKVKNGTATDIRSEKPA